MDKPKVTPDNRGSPTYTFTNVLFYTLCITSLGFSIFIYLRQTQLEDSVRHIRHLEERMITLEARLQNDDVPLSYLKTSTADDFADIASDMRKLSLQVSGIQRLRRDVSQLQIGRRERQVSVQQSNDCGCPPGMFVCSILFFLFFIFTSTVYTITMQSQLIHSFQM